jgi:hypothetical protein
MEKGMMKRFSLIALLLVVVCWTVAQAQNRIVDVLANKIIQKYQQSSCEELAKQKSEPKSPKEQEVGTIRLQP